MMSNILNVNINGRNYVITVLRFDFVVVIDRFPLTFSHLLFYNFSVFSVYILLKSSLDSYVYISAICIKSSVTDSSFGNFTNRMLTYRFLFGNYSTFIHSEVKKREAF